MKVCLVKAFDSERNRFQMPVPAMHLKFIVEIIGNIWALTLTVYPMSIFSSLCATQTCAVFIPRWMQPCRGSLGSDPEVLIPSVPQNMQQSDRLIAHRLWMKANEVKLIATMLRDQMAQERIQSTVLQVYLDENTTIPGFPDHRMLSPRTKFIERLQEDYRRVSIASIFVEQMRRDEEQSSYSPSYTVHFRHIESQIYPLLCQLKMAVLGKGEQLPYVSDDVINNSLRNIDTHAQRHMRDYRILKDAVRLFHNIQRDYGNIRSGNQYINMHVDNS